MLWNSVALKKIFFDSLPLTGCDASQNCSIFICLINLFTIYALTLAMRGQHMYWIAHHRYCNFLGNFNKWWKKPHLNIYPSLSKQELWEYRVIKRIGPELLHFWSINLNANIHFDIVIFFPRQTIFIHIIFIIIFTFSDKSWCPSFWRAKLLVTR